MRSLQELADEAFRDLLKKHRCPVTLKDALRQSVRMQPANDLRRQRAVRRSTFEALWNFFFGREPEPYRSG
jgi:hypothetical protein